MHAHSAEPAWRWLGEQRKTLRTRSPPRTCEQEKNPPLRSAFSQLHGCSMLLPAPPAREHALARRAAAANLHRNQPAASTRASRRSREPCTPASPSQTLQQRHETSDHRACLAPFCLLCLRQRGVPAWNQSMRSVSALARHETRTRSAPKPPAGGKCFAVAAAPPAPCREPPLPWPRTTPMPLSSPSARASPCSTKAASAGGELANHALEETREKPKLQGDHENNTGG